MDSKLKCVFEMNPTTEDVTNSTTGDSEETVTKQESVKWTTDAKAPSKVFIRMKNTFKMLNQNINRVLRQNKNLNLIIIKE